MAAPVPFITQSHAIIRKITQWYVKQMYILNNFTKITIITTIRGLQMNPQWRTLPEKNMSSFIFTSKIRFLIILI